MHNSLQEKRMPEPRHGNDSKQERSTQPIKYSVAALQAAVLGKNLPGDRTDFISRKEHAEENKK